MNATVKAQTGQRPHITDNTVDVAVNALFSALTRDLGRPFEAGGRNVRHIVKKWCPLLQDTQLDVDAFRHSYVPSHFFDRYFYAEEVARAGILEKQAFEKFKANLARGYFQNEWRLRFLPYGRLNSVLMSASMEIQRALGPLETDEWFPLCCHGPNATAGVRKDDAYADRKAIALDGTLPAILLHREYRSWNSNYDRFLEPVLASGEVEYEQVAGSRLSFVAKKFDSLRTMMVEPSINQFLQQGLGGLISQKLKRAFSIDLSEQPEVHRDLARAISAYGYPLATIDWSQASDRIWHGLCQRLLPSDWFAAMWDVRSPVATYKGQELTLTMMGSMGNGFTFPLQTLIFLCLLRALASESGKPQFVNVFGDDCICESSLKDDITWLAEELGWQMNASKSFFDGDFRESCGMDAYRGEPCRPFMIQRPDSLDILDVVSWAYGAYDGVVNSLPRYYKLPSVWDWLIEFLGLVGYEHIDYVPGRFSGTSGVRVHDFDAFNLPVPPHLVGDYPLKDYYYPYSGYHFSYLATVPHKVGVNQEPYYLLALEGKGVPRDFKKAKLCLEESLDNPMLCPLGIVPAKVFRRGRKTGFVHNWTYYTD